MNYNVGQNACKLNKTSAVLSYEGHFENNVFFCRIKTCTTPFYSGLFHQNYIHMAPIHAFQSNKRGTRIFKIRRSSLKRLKVVKICMVSHIYPLHSKNLE